MDCCLSIDGDVDQVLIKMPIKCWLNVAFEGINSQSPANAFSTHDLGIFNGYYKPSKSVLDDCSQPLY